MSKAVDGYDAPQVSVLALGALCVLGRSLGLRDVLGQSSRSFTLAVMFGLL